MKVTLRECAVCGSLNINEADYLCGLGKKPAVKCYDCNFHCSLEHWNMMSINASKLKKCVSTEYHDSIVADAMRLLAEERQKRRTVSFMDYTWDSGVGTLKDPF